MMLGPNFPLYFLFFASEGCGGGVKFIAVNSFIRDTSIMESARDCDCNPREGELCEEFPGKSPGIFLGIYFYCLGACAKQFPPFPSPFLLPLKHSLNVL